MAAHLDAATHGLLTALRDYDRSNNWCAQGFPTCATWLSWRVGMSAGTAREHVRVAQRLGDLPLIDDALRTGSISYSKVRAMTRVATAANEAMLLEDARHSTGQQLETICRKYAIVVRASKEVDEDYDRQRRTFTRHDLEDGMVRLSATLHPEEAAIVMAALDQIARERAMRVQLAAQMNIEVDANGSPVTGQGTTAAPVSSPGSASPGASANGGSTEEAISARLASPRGEFSRVDALISMAQSVVRGDSPRRSPVELVVTVAADVLRRVPAGTSQAMAFSTNDFDGRVPAGTSVVPPVERATWTADLQDGVPAGTSGVQLGETSVPFAVFADGTCVSAETARRLACDCGVVHMTEDENGNPLSVGRMTRSIPTPIKRALDKRDPCCRFPGCTNRLYVEGHHIRHWANGGETSLPNLVNLCSFHHRFVHEYGYRVELDDAQQSRFFDRHGSEILDVPEPMRRDRVGFDVIAERNGELEIDAETNACLWDGHRVHYGEVIDALVRVDRLS